MIYTLTLNPAVDLLVDVAPLTLGNINIATRSIIKAGGKGINVSLVLKELQKESIALGFIGGETGQIIIKELDKQNIKHDFIQVDDNTRINIKINSNKETAINTPSPLISEEKFNQLINKISKLTKNDILIVSGSVPESISLNQFEILLNTIDSKKINVVYDLSKDYLKQCLKHKSLFVKPNIDEIKQLLNVQEIDTKNLINIIRKEYLSKCQYFIISLGSDGVLLITKESTYEIEPIKCKVFSTVGAGDSLVGGFLSALLDGKNPLESLKEATIIATSALYKNGLPTIKDINDLKNSNIKITYTKEQA